jgi:hypothetical protein
MPVDLPRNFGDVQASQEELWLLGQPPLIDYLDFVRRHVIDGDQIARDKVVTAWRKANDRFAKLERSEAGLAEQAECLNLPDDMQADAETLQRQDFYRQTFDRVPTHIAMIELDKIIVSQRHVTLPFVKDLAARIDPSCHGPELFRLCQPLHRCDAPIRLQRLTRDRYAFVSDSTDLRFHEATMLRPDQVTGYQSFGPIAGILGLVVGHGSNFLSVIRWGNRMVLHNGYHRACALRMAGITHVPAVVQTVSRKDEMEIVAADALIDDPAFYFRAKRPPLLKDFFDPKTSTVLRVKRKRKMIEVSFTVTEADIEDI